MRHAHGVSTLSSSLAGVEAEIFGKPEPAIFEGMIADLGAGFEPDLVLDSVNDLVTD